MNEIVFSIGGIEFKAKLLEKEAPERCREFWNALPIETNLHHAKMAGFEVLCYFFKPGLKLSEKNENKRFIRDMNPGDIWGNGFGFGMVYGEVSNEPSPQNVFARVTEKGELEKMKKACISVWRNNGQKITVRKSG